MMSWNHDSNSTTERVVGVAAAAYVINLIAEPSIQDQKKTSEGLEPSLIGDKSRKEETTFPILNPGTVSEGFPFPGEDSTKGSESAESKVPITDATDEKATRPAPSFKRSLAFAYHIGSTSSSKPKSSQKPDLLSSQPESAAPKPDLPPIKSDRTEPKPDLPTIKPERTAPKPDLPTTKPVSTAPKPDLPTTKPVSTAPKPHHPPTKPGIEATRPEQPPTIKPMAPGMDAKRQSAARPETEQTKAEAWEKAEMAKITERYVKLNSTILAWEEKKKKKARNKLDKAESESAHKRARALTKFRDEMDYIKQVTDGARAQALARQRNDELKAKEKANIIRTTGEVPRTCFCC
ncbi:hypothetical protein REPUB_Repub04eG0244600 [Reevesia pubescens]